MRRNRKLYYILKASLILAVFVSFVFTGVSNVSKLESENKPYSDFFITYDQLQGLRDAHQTLLLDVQDMEDAASCCRGIEGSTVVTLFDLSCGSCIEKKLRTYDSIIVYSQDSQLRNEAADLLRQEMYVVYELIEAPPVSLNPEINTRGLSKDRYTTIQLSNTNTYVGVYEREGRISRLFGEAFSHGVSPMESAESFIENNNHMLGVNPQDLHYSHVQPVMFDQEAGSYKFTAIYFNQYKIDIPVFDARLVLLIRNEEGYPLVLASADLRNLQDFFPEIHSNLLNPLNGITSALKVAPSLVNFTTPKLVVWAGIDDMIDDPTVAYSFIADNGVPSDGTLPEKYLFVTDAETGAILYKENMILFVDVYGNVQGKATQGKAADFCEEELPEVLKWARVNIGGTVSYTDGDGNFILSNSGSSPVTVQSRLWGQWFRVYNYTGTDTILSLSVTPPGPANFMHNEQNNNERTRAEVNGYVQANVVRDFTLTYNPSYPGLQQNEFPVYVNRNDGYCPGNAWYDYSSINFCRSGSGYPNTAWSTIIHHEYGHHLVNMGGSGQGQYGEGMSDTIGMLITDDPGVGYGFYGDCDQPLRTADNTIQYPCDGEIHYCGQLLSGCIWSTRNELIITNPETDRDILANLAVNSILLHTGTSIDPSITIDFLTLDDDNGNIYDGTPHYNEIATGFGTHNMPAPPLNLLAFSFPDGLPPIVSPDGGSTVRVVVTSVSGDPQPGTGIFYYNTGSGWQQTPMTQIESNVYDATFPGTLCLTTISYYFSAEAIGGQIQYSPTNAPSQTYSTVSAYSAEVTFTDDFETDKSWVVQNSGGLTDGAWERGIPVGGGVRGDPPTDYDDSGQCYLTANRPDNSDVDDGYTWLISPTFDLSEWDNAQIYYAIWYTNNFGNAPNSDYFRVYVSNNNGASWVEAHVIGPETPLPEAWYTYGVMIGDYVTLNNQIKVRFEASDLGTGSVVEAGVDAVSLVGYSCQAQQPNNPPVFGTPTPENASTNQPLTLPWSIPINDPEGDQFSWTIQCSNGQTNSATGATNGSKTLTLSGLVYSTTYKVWVNATDPTGSTQYTRMWYTFTTEEDPSMTIVQPLAYTILRGVHVSGDLTDLYESDDQYLSILAGFTMTSQEPPVWLQIETAAPLTTPSQLMFTFEAHMNSPGVVMQTIKLLNYTSGSFDTLDQRVVTTSDQVVTIVMTTAAVHYIHQETKEMMAQYMWKATGPTSLFPWMIDIDESNWAISS